MRRPIPVAPSEVEHVVQPLGSFLLAGNKEGLMLVLARKCGEAIVIPEANVVITILEKHGDRIRVGIEAPPEVRVHRREIWERIHREHDSTCEGQDCSPSPSSASAVAH